MKFTRVVAIAIVLASGGGAATHAQTLRNSQEPAEFPPASYKGTQYVDSRGCVYVRAGISGNVTWIPRVTRSRQVVCNAQPTLVANATKTAPKPKVDAPVQITLEDAPKPKPAPKKAVAKPKPKPVRTAAVRKPVAAKKSVKVQRKAPIAAKPVAQIPVQTAAVGKPLNAQRSAAAAQVRSSCAGVSGVSDAYLQTSSKHAVRCGPQTQNLSSTGGRRVAQGTQKQVATGTISAGTRVVPKHVAINRQNTQNQPLPNGYRRVWQDGRLNPKRAEQTLEGRAQMRLIWTNTVPRRLIDQNSGRDVTAKVPLVYPYLDTKTQQRELGTVSLVTRDGQVLKRVQRNEAIARQPTLSTRSAPVPQKAKPQTAQRQPVKQQRVAAAGGQFVQVGTFSQAANAQKTAQRVQRMGLPVRIGKYTRGSKTFRVVIAGPFNNNAKMALGQVRRAGFRDAYIRK